MAQDKTFGDAVKIEFQRQRHALQVSKDILQGVFSRRSLKDKQTSVAISGKLSSNTKTVATTNDGTIRPDTPSGTQLPWTRRISKAAFRDIKIDVNRISAKYLGMSVSELAARSVTAYMATRARDKTTMMLNALVDTYVENPQIVTAQTAASNKPFPNTQNFLPNVTGTGSNRKAPLNIKSFFDLCAIHDDALGINAYGQGKMDGSLDSITRVAIFSNKGWSAFNATNAAVLGNKETFGKSIYIDGYGMFMNIHNTLIVVLNGEFETLPTATDVATGGAFVGVGFDPTTSQGSYITPGEGTRATGDYTVQGLHRMYLVYPDAMDVRVPEQYEIDPIHYMEQAKSLERAIYGGIGLECIRIFDKVVSRVWFGSDFTNLTAAA